MAPYILLKIFTCRAVDAATTMRVGSKQYVLLLSQGHFGVLKMEKEQNKEVTKPICVPWYDLALLHLFVLHSDSAFGRNLDVWLVFIHNTAAFMPKFAPD